MITGVPANELREAEFHDCQFESVQWLDCDLGRASFHQDRFVSSEFRRCLMAGFRGLSNLRGAAMELDDMLVLADALALELGIARLE